mmetsp:Transcript_151470/g.486136  ORF Transcript_151470/g.486136 Transcript_151470/m.486136 type:complete len:388 (+) Transcript_151470:887-2050(+)
MSGLNGLLDRQLAASPIPVLLLGAGRRAAEQRAEPCERLLLSGARRAPELAHARSAPVGGMQVEKCADDLVNEGLRIVANGYSFPVGCQRPQHEEGHETGASRGLGPGVGREALQCGDVQGLVGRQAVCHGHRREPHDGAVAGVVVRRPKGPRHGLGGLLRGRAQLLDFREGLGDVAAEADGGPAGPGFVVAEGIAITVGPPHVPADSQVASVVAALDQQRVGHAEGHTRVIGPLARLQHKLVKCTMILRVATLELGQQARPVNVPVATPGAVRQPGVHGRELQRMPEGITNGHAHEAGHSGAAARVRPGDLLEQPPTSRGARGTGFAQLGERRGQRRPVDEAVVLLQPAGPRRHTHAKGRRAVQALEELVQLLPHLLRVAAAGGPE